MSADTGPAIPHPAAGAAPPARADMTLTERPGGGRIFAAGSIGWCASLAHAGDDNDISRITRNVLAWFAE